MSYNPQPIGMLDSGVGGLSILREVHRQLPNEDILYVADQGHVPYGPRSITEIRRFTHGITEFFLDKNTKAIVLACNAASAASLHYLRKSFPNVPFVGMEPAVKPAATNTQTGVIGVLTTKATFQGKLFNSVVDRYASDIKVETQICPEFVTLVEAGHLTGTETRKAIEQRLHPILEAGADQIVLGCTHFPFLIPVLTEVAGERAQIIDPSPAIARQTERVISDMRNSGDHKGHLMFFTSGNPGRFHILAEQLLKQKLPRSSVHGLSWHGEHLKVV